MEVKNMDEKLKYGLGGLIIGGFLVWIMTFMIVDSNNSKFMGMMGFRGNTQQSPMKNTDSIDAHFIEQMIPHHEDAITMAKIAKTKSQRPEIQQLSQDIITSQGQEINQMKDWYKSWFGKEVPSNQDTMSHHGMTDNSSKMHMGMMGNDMDMTRLESAENFDKVFLEDMIVHHQMAVMMANMLKNSTFRPEMKSIADNIIRVQTEEIEMMRTWLSDLE
jgi:uncharacterized protein (DUF305 family)